MLSFYHGTMGAGKTTKLIEEVNRIKRNKLGRVIVLKPETDTKGGKNLVTRDQITLQVFDIIKKEENLYESYSSLLGIVDYICIDEAQFLSRSQVEQLKDLSFGMDILTFGLRLNAFNEDSGFEGATRLLQLADRIIEVEGTCPCGNKTDCNARFLNNSFVGEGPDILIDGTSSIEYRGLCWLCYKKYKESTCKIPANNL